LDQVSFKLCFAELTKEKKLEKKKTGRPRRQSSPHQLKKWKLFGCCTTKKKKKDKEIDEVAGLA
jgi:hypothetical protein